MGEMGEPALAGGSIPFLSIRRIGVSPVSGFSAGFGVCTTEIFACIGRHPGRLCMYSSRLKPGSIPQFCKVL